MTLRFRTTAVGTLAAAILLTPALLSPATATATPSSGVSATTLAEADIPPPDSCRSSRRACTSRSAEITIAPEGTTGWHYHDAQIYALVRQGTLTHPGADCKPVVYRAGEIIEEPAGKVNTHEGTNLGTVPVILDVLYLMPPGKPLSEDADAPACAQP